MRYATNNIKIGIQFRPLQKVGSPLTSVNSPFSENILTNKALYLQQI